MDHDYDFSRKKNYQSHFGGKKIPTEIVAAFQPLKRRNAIGTDRISREVIKVNFEILQHCFM